MDKTIIKDTLKEEHVSLIQGPIIIGAGPSGLAVAASLTGLSIPYIILERSNNIADLWTNHTYDRLSLHLPKRYCELPYRSFPPHFPTYPSKSQFLHYLETYSLHFSIKPLFSHNVIEAKYDNVSSLWRVKAMNANGDMKVYMSKWIVVASGENTERMVARIKGTDRFRGGLMHSSEYKNGEGYKGKKVLVIGCGNSGMEMCLDLFEHGALPFISVRSGVHILPREMFGTSTFGIAMNLLKWFPVKWVDKFLVMASKIILGETEKYGLKKPKLGPLEIKGMTGKNPVLDVGALALIKSGNIKVVPEVESLTSNGGRFIDGNEMPFDSILFATGYTSNVSFWLKDSEFFTGDGKPRSPLLNTWKGKNGLYIVGFSGRGLLGVSMDAVKVAHDIAEIWSKIELEHDSVV